jgi:hypothetical protein
MANALGGPDQMKRAVLAAALVVSLALPAAVSAASPPAWDLTGTYKIEFTCTAGCGDTYLHSMTITSSDPTTGAVVGSGSVDGLVGYDWTVTGTVSGSDVALDIEWVSPPELLGYNPLLLTGTIDGSGGMSGTAIDGQARTFTWTTTAGAAVPLAGFLRVTSSPALPTQISIDGVIADSWGLNWVQVPAGSHTVSFSHVEGWAEPAPAAVTVSGGATTTVTGSFTQRGTLRVVTSPPVAGTISVDGIPRDAWGMWTDLPTGLHNVCFGPVAGYAAPACQDVTLTAGNLSTVTGTYTADGNALGATGVGTLRVTSDPALPTQVSIDGVIADSWGLNWVEVAPGSHMVCFSHVEGYTEPACDTQTVTAGATTTITGTFTQRGTLRVLTSPAVAATISVDGTPRNAWGVWTDLPTGSHQVCFGPVAGYTAPACQDITLSAGVQTDVTGTYTGP